MATVNLRKCDVFGVLVNVQGVRVKVEVMLEGESTWMPSSERTLDMGKRAFERLMLDIDHGTSPPSKKKADGNAP